MCSSAETVACGCSKSHLRQNRALAYSKAPERNSGALPYRVRQGLCRMQLLVARGCGLCGGTLLTRGRQSDVEHGAHSQTASHCRYVVDDQTADHLREGLRDAGLKPAKN